MDAKELNNCNLDLKQFFDFANHNHIYHFHIRKGDFSLRETRTAATYSDIADRFESAIAWIKNVRKQDRPFCCPECGGQDNRVARVLYFAVMTGDDDVFRESYDDLSWDDMIRLLQMAVSRLREMSEPLRPCSKCGKVRAVPDNPASGSMSGDVPAGESNFYRDSDRVSNLSSRNASGADVLLWIACLAWRPEDSKDGTGA